MASVRQIRKNLSDWVRLPIVDDRDQARFALVARDAFWYPARAVIKGGTGSGDYDDFVDWQHQLVHDQRPYGSAISRTLADQALNASTPQIREYASYLEAFVGGRRGRDPWANLGDVQLRWSPKGPYDDGAQLTVAHVLAEGEHESRAHVLDEDDPNTFDEAVRAGWLWAFEAMVPLRVHTKWGARAIWEPWVRRGDRPGDAAEALERLYTKRKMEDLHTAGLGRLVGPIGVASVLLDPDTDAEFWAGEWTNEFLARAPDEQTGIAVLRQRAPKLAAAIGEDTYEANPPRVVSSVHTVLAPLSPDQPEAFGDGVWDITFRGDDAKPAQQLLGRAGWRKHGKATAHAVAMRKGRVELQIVVRYKRGRVTIDTQP